MTGRNPHTCAMGGITDLAMGFPGYNGRIDGAVVAEADIGRTAPFRFALSGEGMCCGYADGTPVTEAYASPFRFTGVLHEVTVDVSGTPILDLVAEVQRAWMVQ